MKKLLALLVLLGPILPSPAAANKNMVENVVGTNGCFLFQTVPTCAATIQNLNFSTGTILPGGSTNYIQNRSTLQSGATAYPDFLYVGSSGTIPNFSFTNARGVGETVTSLTASSGTFTGNGVLTSTISFSNTATGGILGTQTNNAAAAGMVGEYVESVYAGVDHTVASTQWQDNTSISLTAGDWEVTHLCNANYNPAQVTVTEAGISTTSGNSATGLVQGSNRLRADSTATMSAWIPISISNFRMSLSATTTVYAKFNQTFSGGSVNASGRLSARRIR